MTPTEPVQAELAHLILVSWIVLIPVGVLLTIVLFKLAFLLHTVSEFLGLARYELFPLLQTVQNTATNLELLTNKAVTGVENVERGFANTRPMFQRGVHGAKSRLLTLRDKTGAVVSGLLQGFRKSV